VVKSISFHFSLILLLLQVFIPGTIYSQAELVPVTHPVYDYLKTMQVKEVIPEYNSSMIPITRNEISGYLKKIETWKNLTRIEKKQLEDFKIEFEYELNKTLLNSTSVYNKADADAFFGNKKQKYLYNYSDSNATLFLSFAGDLSARTANGDSGNHSILTGDLGLGLRGTIFERIGYSLNTFFGKKFTGKNSDVQFAADNDPILKSNRDFIRGNNNYDFFNGHMRYQTKDNWLSLTLGREAIECGYGYIDKMFLSNNTIPIDFMKLDLSYKKIKYTFAYGSINGDSIGLDLTSKNIAFHRINVQFTDKFKIGYYETVIMSNNPFSFVYFNPISFITSADLNSGAKETTENNTLMGLDIEINPARNLAMQGTLLIDDINFSTIFKNDITSFDNKFGYQIGTIWTNAFQIPDLNLTVEYTRLNPFVYTHRSNRDSYTNRGLTLGHNLPPNSDEIALKLKYYISSRINIDFLYQFQRSADGIYFDSLKNQIINYGGNINRGDGDNLIDSKFLLGDRVNRNIITFNLLIEPIKQYLIEIQYQYKLLNFIYLSKKSRESYFRAVFRVSI
jgi:hypothetical protein